MATAASDTWQHVTAERLALADLLAPLSAEQWATQSLCRAWTVHGVLAHLVSAMEPGAVLRFVPQLVRAGGNPHRASERATAARVRRDPGPQLVTTLREHAGRRVAPPGLGPRAPLSDTLVHRLDISLPLGIAVDRPVEPWREALDFLGTTTAQRGLGRRGLPASTYVATDLDWTGGRGPEVRGPAAALGLALAGRTVWLDRLDGPGVPALRAWLTR